MNVTKSVTMLERNRKISNSVDKSKVLDRYQEPVGLPPLRDTKTHRQTDGHTQTHTPFRVNQSKLFIKHSSLQPFGSYFICPAFSFFIHQRGMVS